jgi:putative flippase GtrA
MISIIYGFFAAIATLANITAQVIFIKIYEGSNNIILSIFFGTLVGLLAKYLLDKRFIFKFKPRDKSHESKIFFLYVLTGLATTIIFWGTELSFNFYFKSDPMRYLGGAIGLSIGYIIKYHLDKRYVFKKENP